MKPLIKEAISISVVTWSSILQLFIAGSALATSAEFPVTLEPLCSDRNAGVRWNADKTKVYTIRVSFRCIYVDQLKDVITSEEDPCFQGDRIPNLLTIGEDSRAHIISTQLQPGTVCIFTAQSENYIFGDLDPVIKNCTIKDTGTCESNPELCALPAYCIPEGQDCQCSCTEGYTGRADNHIAGVTCIRDETQAGPTPNPQTLNPSGTSLDGSDFTSQNTNSIFVTPTSLSSFSHPASGNIMAVITSTNTVARSRLSVRASSLETTIRNTPADSTSRSQSMSNLPTLSSMITPPTQPFPGNGFPLEEVFPAFLVTILLSVTVIVCFAWVGVYLVKRKRLQRLHSKLTVPFHELRVEKIDPDFNPVTVDKVLFIAESMQSIFHPLETNTNSENLNVDNNPKPDREETCQQPTSFTIETDSTISLDLLTESLDSETISNSDELSEDTISNTDDLSQAEFYDHSTINPSTLSGGGYVRDNSFLNEPSVCVQVPQTAQTDAMFSCHTPDIQYSASVMDTSANTSSNSSSSDYVMQSTPLSSNMQLEVFNQTNHFNTTHMSLQNGNSLNPNIDSTFIESNGVEQNDTLPLSKTNLHIVPAALHTLTPYCEGSLRMSSHELVEQRRFDIDTKFTSSKVSTEIPQEGSLLQDEPLAFVLESDVSATKSCEQQVNVTETHLALADDAYYTVRMTECGNHDNNLHTSSDKPKIYFSFPQDWSEI